MPAGKKTRAGCARCKEKRLKCDEAVPQCYRCRRAHEVCPGYQRVLRWSTKHEVLPHNASQPRASRYRRSNSTRDTASTNGGRNIVDRAVIDMDGLPGISSSDALSVAQDDTRIDQLIISHTPPPVVDSICWTEMPALGSDFPPNGFVDFEVQRQTSMHPEEFEDGIYQLAYIDDDDIAQASEPHRQRNVGYSRGPTASSSSSLSPLPLQENLDSIWPMIVHPEYALVEYYFKEVAVICSCYDGAMNPFRSTIARIWTSSNNMTKTLQSMAAACLAPSYPHLAQEGFKLRQEVAASIGADSNSQDSVCVTLLIAIMLGQTSGWHNPKDLGLGLYRRAKGLLQQLESDTSVLEHSIIEKDITFFRNAVGYWEAMFAFVMPGQELYPHTRLSMEAEPSLLLIRPHPWSFVAPELMNVVRQVGQLIWTNRTMHHRSKFWRESDLRSQVNAIKDSARLEQCLLECELPAETGLVDPQDATTPVSHLLTISQAYRLVGLIMIYRVFPDVLIAQMQSEESLQALEHCFSVHSVDNLNPLAEHDRNIWLRQLALYALRLVKSIPLSSHTRCVQPFLLLALSCDVGSVEASSLYDADPETIEARTFIQRRLEAFLYCLPPKPAQCRIDLVLEIWRNLDSGKRNVFWIDVVIENDWRFLFG